MGSFEFSEEQNKILECPRSSFIFGRAGTGKTEILVRKLWQKKEQKEGEGETVRQLFLTSTPRLCHVVKQKIARLKRFGSDAPETNLGDDFYGIPETNLGDEPNSFIGIQDEEYPLVITFQKFLLILDGTIGPSYFERFDVTSVPLQTLIREKEVTYDRFYSWYWPHFNKKLTKKLDPSRVFTEIVCHIKGGLTTGDHGKLTKEEYISMSQSRVSTLSAGVRERIYDIFQTYEKRKMERAQYDLSDVVNDIHLRLMNHHQRVVDFVYVDEVQDITLRQLGLLKYVCTNVEDGFVFSGDTAQTIARGVDFRFEDVKNLFYSEFGMGDKDKGHVFFKLILNFRTHEGVLRLAQSVITLLHYYFPQSVDVVNSETSHSYGVAPVLLKPKPGADANAIITIFGNSESTEGKIIGFGAEQVILVRDESAKKEVSEIIGRKALILTIAECKGLEFQDVLLYNFFGSSPLKNYWRVVYKYMEEQGLLKMPSPSFSAERQSVLCSELKQLYVAITRTRQRLWICESLEEYSKPMFEYWRLSCLVDIKEIDDSLAQVMQTSSTPEEWKSLGLKLFWDKNYEMASMCFEKAGEKMWEESAMAASLREYAERIRDSHPEKARTKLREAADKFYSAGRFQSAAECFCDLKEYDQAGKIYLEKCVEPELRKAAECFALAGCYEKAAEIYAKGSYISECLSVCTKAKCFDLGLKYVEQHAAQGNIVEKEAYEIEKIKEFLENCASDYFNLHDRGSMMKFVKAFPSVDMKRKFLKSVKCLHELLFLEEELGNFTKAADIRNFLNESKDLDSRRYFEKVFPLDPRESLLEKKMVSLRRSEFSFDLLQEFIREDIGKRGRLSYGQIGRIVMIWLATRKLPEDLYKNIVGRIPTAPWKSFLEILSSAERCQSGPMQIKYLKTFHEALQVTFVACLTGQEDPMSPACLLYLIERFLILVTQSYRQGTFYTSRSSLMEWLVSEQFDAALTSLFAKDMSLLERIYDSILVMVKVFIYDKSTTFDWISRSKVKDGVAYYKILVWRSVSILILMFLNVGAPKYYFELANVLGNDDSWNHIQGDFLESLVTLKSSLVNVGEMSLDMMGQTFRIAKDALFSVNRRGTAAPKYANNITWVQLGTNRQREAFIEIASITGSDKRIQMNWAVFQEISDLLKQNDGTSANTSGKGGINANIKFLTAAITLLGEKKPYAGEEMIKEVHSMLQELKQLHSLLDTSDSETSIEGLLKSLLSRTPKLESLLNQCIVPKGSSEEKVDALSGELEKMEMTSNSTESGSSNQGAKKTQQKGKGNSKKSKKGKKK